MMQMRSQGYPHLFSNRREALGIERASAVNPVGTREPEIFRPCYTNRLCFGQLISGVRIAFGLGHRTLDQNINLTYFETDGFEIKIQFNLAKLPQLFG